MACVTGTNIVNDGLVFHFDLENGVKSFKGKPTSNLFADSKNLSTTNWLNYNTSYDTESKRAYIISNTSGNFFLQDRSLVSGEYYTISLEAKADEASWIQFAPSTGFSSGNYANISLVDGTIAGTAGGISSASAIELSDGWWRVSYTAPATSTGSGRIAFAISDGPDHTRLAAADGLPVNSGLFIRGAQMEQGTFATKYVNGVRLDTASIVDLSPNRSTITAANLTYRQDDTPTFDGTNDYMLTDISTINQNATYEIWVKRSQSVNAYNMMMGQYLPYFAFRSDNRVHFSSSISGQKNLFTDYNVVSDNTWYNIVFIHDYDGTNTDVSIYVNGEIKANNTYAGAQATNSGGRNFMIAGWRSDNPASYPFSGEISQVKIYNKALTDAEVKQNFEATRTRYGI